LLIPASTGLLFSVDSLNWGEANLGQRANFLVCSTNANEYYRTYNLGIFENGEKFD
jgi:hypothetical protein